MRGASVCGSGAALTFEVHNGAGKRVEVPGVALDQMAQRFVIGWGRRYARAPPAKKYGVFTKVPAGGENGRRAAGYVGAGGAFGRPAVKLVRCLR